MGRLRIINDELPVGVRVIDDETGVELRGVKSVSVEFQVMETAVARIEFVDVLIGPRAESAKATASDSRAVQEIPVPPERVVELADASDGTRC